MTSPFPPAQNPGGVPGGPVAGRYDVLCDPQNAERARDMLSRLTL